MVITLLDVDDSCPIFSQQVFTGTITENANLGTPVIIVRKAVA